MNELKTLIDLCPGTRLPQYEVEIFSDTELTDYYLRKLCEQYDPSWKPVPRLVYLYAFCVMESRWPEAEHIIATDAYWCKWYNMEFGTSL